MAKPGAMAVTMAENRRLKERIAYLEEQAGYWKSRCRVIHMWAAQLNDDLIAIVQADSAVMGKDTFGPERITRISDARNALMDKYVNALEPHPEADYLREDIDRRLKQIMKDRFAPWKDRYFGWEE